jgi:ABC-type multidrug transport system ATPase subunit
MIGELRSSGTTILHATHLIEEAESLVDSVVIIDHGRVVARGEAATLASDLGIPRYELQARPRAEVSADFVPPIGTWDGRSVRVPLSDLGETLAAAVAALESMPGGVEGVRLREASLEEAFLRLTGRELRE